MGRAAEKALARGRKSGTLSNFYSEKSHETKSVNPDAHPQNMAWSNKMRNWLRNDFKMRSFIFLINFALGNHFPFHSADLIPDGVNAQTCGASEFGRIVGGQSAKPHSWPWLVRFLMNGRHSCGGSIMVQFFSRSKLTSSFTDKNQIIFEELLENC